MRLVGGTDTMWMFFLIGLIVGLALGNGWISW